SATSWTTAGRAVGPGPPAVWCRSLRTRSHAILPWPGPMPKPSATNSWRFPPQTREVQVDEKWGFVFQKEAACDPLDPQDLSRGDDWDHTAIDPETRLLLCLVPGKRDGLACRQVIREIHDRT